MADKASRGLVIYGDGLARFVDPTHTHLHKLASLACCGFLSLPQSPPSESEDARTLREFAQLLDVGDSNTDIDVSEGSTAMATCGKSTSIKSISDRFMGMRAAMLTDNPSLSSFGGKHGLYMLQLQDFFQRNDASAQPSHDVLASELLKLLGFHDGKILEASQFDLVFFHIGAHEIYGQKDIDFVNSLLGEVLQIVAVGSDIGSRLHLSLVLGYGDVPQNDDTSTIVSATNPSSNPDLSLLFPRQSYNVKGSIPRKDVRPHCPMLTAQWQSGVTRKDTVKEFLFQEFKEHCGNLTIPADRFIHEVAFKLWKAPKYGA